MKNILLIYFLFFITLGYSQGEGVMPITHNVEIMGKPKYLNKSSSTFDSTFIYTVDTLSLPFYDEFSKNKIEKYNANFSDPGVTSELFYAVLDENDIPISPNDVFTTQQTFRRVYDTGTDLVTTTNFPGITVKVSDLSTYPVTYQTKTVYPPYYIFDTLGVPDVPDTIWIVGPDVFQFTATQFKAHASTPGALWIDDYAYHNYRYAKNPWSLGVATFDGIDNNGYPYQMGTTLSGVADYLTSKPIDLSGNSPADSLYLTFLYQKQGLGDIPESTDSLILEFYDKSSQRWFRQWGVNGGAVSEFEVAHIPVKNPTYFNDAFQFRLKNYGGLSGALDHFHVDYVHLRDLSGYQDTLIEDFAISYPIVTLLKDYSSVPWDHYKNNSTGKMSTEVPLVVRNSYLNGGSNISSAGGGKINILYGGVQEGSVTLNGQTIVSYDPFTQPIPDYAPRTTYFSGHDVSTMSFDPSKPGTKQSFTIETIVTVPVGSNYQPNDTTYTEQVFQNYYSYDDGSAELAYGPQGAQSRLAVKYVPYEADSIIGAMIHFVPTVNNVTNKLFQLTIWDDNGGIPGTVLYQDNSFNLRQPSYGGGINKFVTYFTDDTLKVPVSGTFYIGWRQIDALRLGVGLDQNTDKHENTFFSLDGGVTWEQSQIPGSVMIRPIFSTSLDPELGVKEIKKESLELVIYPNPSNGVFTVASSTGETGQVQVFSLMGNLILTTNEQTFDLSNQPEGMYLVRSTLDISKTYKVVKTR